MTADMVETDGKKSWRQLWRVPYVNAHGCIHSTFQRVLLRAATQRMELLLMTENCLALCHPSQSSQPSSLCVSEDVNPVEQ